jgi:thiol-disulfide isomerase/thioredoxin
MKKILGLFLSLYMLVGCVVDNHEEPFVSEEVLVVGDCLPSFSVNVIDGDSTYVFSSDHLTGRTVIVFFHTGCSDCQRELPELNDYYLRHRDEPGFQMVAIAREEMTESVAAYWQANSLSIPFSPQSDRRIYNLFATVTIPRVYICSPSGIVEWIGIETFTIID